VPKAKNPGGLTPKERKFVREYCTNGFNATKAARAAGYSRKTARQTGYELKRKPAIAAAINKLLESVQMSDEEIVARLEDIAGATLEDFLVVDAEEDGTPIRQRIDLGRAKAAGKLHLLHKVSETRFGIAVELRGADKALELLARRRGLLTDRLELTGRDGGPIEHQLDLAALPASELAARYRALLKDEG
jgi:phage terminase small subunit